jgi:hypothetical protein
VVVIPKPRKDDYSVAKSYRPISLLECMSKLIEKAMSKRFLYDTDKFGLIPTTQYGTRAHSSTLDAGLGFTHDVQTALNAKLNVGQSSSTSKVSSTTYTKTDSQQPSLTFGISRPRHKLGPVFPLRATGHAIF